MLDDLIDNDGRQNMRADLEEHLRGCEHCEVTLNTTRKTIQIYRSHEIYEMPDQPSRPAAQSHHGPLQKRLLTRPPSRP